MNFQNIRNKQFLNLCFAIISGVCFSLGWVGFSSYSIFIAFIPLLFIEKINSRKLFLLYSTVSIVLWNLLTTFWIAKAAVIGIVAATIDNWVLMIIPLFLYSYTKAKIGKPLGYIIFIAAVLAFQYFDFNGEISWPMLTLGNVFSANHKIVQWYEYTGVFGGSLWILLVNILLFEAIVSNNRLIVRYSVLILVFIAPIIFSLYLYKHYIPSSAEQVRVSVIQPNFDPYGEKFEEAALPRQITIVDSLIETVDTQSDIIVTPETTFNYTVREEEFDNDPVVGFLRQRLDSTHTQADLIMGASTQQTYRNCGNERPTITARPYGKGNYYDFSNSTLAIRPGKATEIYKKSKLVIGVEMLPYQGLWNKWASSFSVDLGGISGSLAGQESPSLFTVTQTGKKIGAPICYEVVYGEYFSEFVRQGAELMVVITNDGWWGDTYGYHQLFNLSRLRAIETRRAIARSANTGISGFFDQRGDVIDSLGWWKRGALTATLPASKELTVYVKSGDYLGRVSVYVLCICLLLLIAINFKKKMN